MRFTVSLSQTYIAVWFILQALSATYSVISSILRSTLCSNFSADNHLSIMHLIAWFMLICVSKDIGVSVVIIIVIVAVFIESHKETHIHRIMIT